jgi:hypothetical protein
MRATETEQGYSSTNVPDEYSRPDGDPFEVILTDQALITAVEEAEEGVWGVGSSCKIPPVKGSATLHKYDVEENAAVAIAMLDPPWKQIITIDVMEHMLDLGKGKKDVVMSEKQIRAALRWGLLETSPPPDLTRDAVHVRLSHYGWLWVHWKTGYLLCEAR